MPGHDVVVSLEAHVTALEREADALEGRCALREKDVRAPAVAAEAELAAVEEALEDERARLAVFTAELSEAPPRMVLTPLRALLTAAALGAFTWGITSSTIDPTKPSVLLFVATWVAFLAGALRGR